MAPKPGLYNKMSPQWRCSRVRNLRTKPLASLSNIHLTSELFLPIVTFLAIICIHQLTFVVGRVDCDQVEARESGVGGRSDVLIYGGTRGESSFGVPSDSLQSTSIEASDGTAAALNRIKRFTAAYARGQKLGRVPLAQRPRTTTTTTTTTTSTSSTTEEPSEEAAADESDEGDDYEELVSTTRQSTPTSRSSTASSSEPAEEPEGEGEEEQEGEEVGEEGGKVGGSSSTSTTQPSTTLRKTGGPRKGAAMRNKSTGRQTGGAKSAEVEREAAALERDRNERPAKGRKKGQSNNDDGLGDDADDDKRGPMPTEAPGAADSSRAAGAMMDEPGRAHGMHAKKRPLVALPFIKPKNLSICTPEAYLEFPHDLIGEKWRSRGLILIHVLVICYMFYSLALVCERYFMPSLEEFAQRLQISEDVAGATLMSAGSSAPELFTAILGVFVAKGDVGTGAIVGSAVFNILFVIGVCAFVSTTTAQLQWWPVLRDSVYYTFTVLVLILIIYDERITALESASMICLYGVYILIMMHNEQLKQLVSRTLVSHPLTAKLISSQSITLEGPDDVFANGQAAAPERNGTDQQQRRQQDVSLATMVLMDRRVEEDAIYLAALLLVVRHKRLFRGQLRFQSAARYVIVKRQHRLRQAEEQRAATRHQEVNYFGPESEPLSSKGAGAKRAGPAASQQAKREAYALSTSLSKSKFSIVSKDDYEFWHRPPQEGENYYLWLAKIPVNYVLHYTVPDCTLQPDKFALTFVISIIWTAVFSYIMVWMVTIIGYTLGIPDSVMGVTFLAAGTSVPDCYSSIHAARNGMADMAVSNSIGSNVFDILIGLAVPWFIQSAIYPGVVATVNSRGVIYSVILLFLSLVITIYLMNRCNWSLQPRLGLALIIAYAAFIILTCMLEFNLFGHVNPPPCPRVTGTNL